MMTPYACPDCGAPLELDTDAETEVLIYRQAPSTIPYLDAVRVHVVVAFCTGCEFSLEVKS